MPSEALALGVCSLPSCGSYSSRTPEGNTERQDSFRRLGSSPFPGATRRAAPSLRSSRLVRIDSPPILNILCALHAHTGSSPLKFSRCVEARFVFRPSPARTVPFLVPAEVLANYTDEILARLCFSTTYVYVDRLISRVFLDSLFPICSRFVPSWSDCTPSMRQFSMGTLAVL
jgi:hypothetical protein